MNMSKKTLKNMNETEKEKLSESLGAGETSILEEPDIERKIEITINSIENFSNIQMIDKDKAEILIRIQHNNIMLGESPCLKPDSLEETAVVNINYAVLFAIAINKQSNREAAISTPILISVIQQITNSDDYNDKITSFTNASGDFENKSKKKQTSVLKLKNAKSNENSFILGICNFDPMPLLLGEKVVTEKLILEVPTEDREPGVSWENLPYLNVSAKLLDTDIFPPEMNVNFLSITIESIYNLPASLTDDLDYKANTVMYVGNEISEDIIFEGGIKTSVPDVEKVKCWQSLAHLKGQVKQSKYKLNTDITKNELKNELDLKLLEGAPRIQWNSMRRSLILHSGCEIMCNIIKRYKYWPFFFAASGKARDISKQKGKELADTLLLFQCYADVSELLYPGTTRTRTVAQLYTFSTSAMAEKTGLDKSVFERELPKEPVKEKETKKVKPSTKGSSLPTTVVVSTEPDYVPSSPIMSESGQPVFVIIEFELYRPLQPARTLEDLTNCIDKMISKYTSSPSNPYTSELAEEQYANCIRKLVDILCGAYQDFKQNRLIPDLSEQRPHKISSPIKIIGTNTDSDTAQNSCDETMESDNQHDCRYTYIKDEIACFIQYLHESGRYLDVRSTLKNKITMLLDQKFKIEMHMLDKKECQNFVASTYIYLVEQMHYTLNKVVEGQQAEELLDSNPTAQTSFFAEESCALGYTNDAREEYLNMIASDKQKPDPWIEYAIYLLQIKDLDRAIECCCEAIALDKQNKIALLLYGLILSGREQYRDAQIFIEIVTQLYPRFAEGWAILHLFYLRTEYFPGADVAIQVAQKCMKDKDPDSITMRLLSRDPLLWTTLNCPKDRIYLVTAVLLMKMSCLDFAGIALAQELLQMGRTRHFLYYMAVHHYIENRYEDAICHLKEAVNLYEMEYSIASLIGHCHLEEGNFDKAIYHYEFANSSFDRPEDLHLVQLRLGYLYLNTEQYTSAKKLFLTICKNSPTCRSWLGVGIACYHLNDMKNAEKSLMEANNQNMHNAEVWGYLCLVNMSLQRYDEFLQCYGQTVKNNLTNVRLWTMIKDLMNNLGYSTPVLSIDSKETLIHESPENEDKQTYEDFNNY